MSQDQPKTALQEAYDLARQNPGKTVILSSSIEKGTSIQVSDTAIIQDTERRKLFSSTHNCNY
ncbi:MAG: hypothetical protein DI626_06410 [Micavibrio aeruginosavorus]|uniref:Uncharacterized protein n=1 Tax=Micavibrio aeruginosavorus TaxID=349221 RepID=A0A2W5BTH3_9BACT|nr:MAG: hypothetical protein DI626_06410 [Micavibrio aeruginosavorus]